MAFNQGIEMGATVALESILCTDELDRRSKRPPDYETENRALVALAQAIADSPRTILQTLADTILEVFACGTAGISLLSKDETRFYWPAIAGVWKPHIGGVERVIVAGEGAGAEAAHGRPAGVGGVRALDEPTRVVIFVKGIDAEVRGGGRGIPADLVELAIEVVGEGEALAGHVVAAGDFILHERLEALQVVGRIDVVKIVRRADLGLQVEAETVPVVLALVENVVAEVGDVLHLVGAAAEQVVDVVVSRGHRLTGRIHVARMRELARVVVRRIDRPHERGPVRFIPLFGDHLVEQRVIGS